MAIPAGGTDRAAVGRRIGRTYVRRPADCSVSRTVPDQIINAGRGGYWVRRRLNIASRDRWIVKYFLFQIANHDIKRATCKKIGRGIIVARLGELPVSCRA